MNLVAKEYCACKTDDDGVLVLSHFAGAAAEMGEALLVNPFDEERVACAVKRALIMEPDERAHRMRRLRERISRNDVFNWADRFIEILQSAEPTQSAYEPLDPAVLASAYRGANRRLLILDYDGTLVPIGPDPSRTAPGPHLLATLEKLSAVKRNVVAVISGRRSSDLDRWLGRVPGLLLSAEHGALVRCPGASAWKTTMPSQSNLDWKDKVRDLFQHFVDRAPGSFIEEKEYTIVWHYRRVEPEFGEWLAGELTALLGGLLAGTDANPTRGRKVVEVRPGWANKGAFTGTLLSQYANAEFRLAIGDDVTDEDIFAHLGPDAFTVHVGNEPGHARYSLPDPRAVLMFLQDLTA
jgi:trehalose 6-phosphate synthase/phosphatase